VILRIGTNPCAATALGWHQSRWRRHDGRRRIKKRKKGAARKATRISALGGKAVARRGKQQLAASVTRRSELELRKGRQLQRASKTIEMAANLAANLWWRRLAWLLRLACGAAGASSLAACREKRASRV